MSLKISVIVPVYNVEDYLDRCLSSILEQTFSDFEILLIDDGSTDSSGAICDDYATKYTNITVIHKENKGLSDTRNVGIKNAKGEYIFFIDSDDFIIPKCLEILYYNATKNKADLSCGSFGYFDDSHPVREYNSNNNKIFKNNGASACILLLYGKKFYTSSCNMLIKRKIANNNFFPLGRYHEDEMTTFRYFLDASVVVKTCVNTYYYYQREGSIMHSLGQPVFDEALAGDYYVDICRDRGRRFLKAALNKKYFLYTEIIENYPQVQIDNPNFYHDLMKYLKSNGWSILMDRFTSWSLRKKAFKYIIQ